jgi:hypothetical protein
VLRDRIAHARLGEDRDTALLVVVPELEATDHHGVIEEIDHRPRPVGRHDLAQAGLAVGW